MSCNPHLDLWRSENHTPPEERRWLAWVADAERLLGGVDLDGDQAADGYSLDTAFDYFESGDTPADFAGDVNVERSRLGLAQLQQVAE